MATNDNTWLMWAIACMVLYGLQAFIYKAIATRGADERTAQIMIPLVVSMLSAHLIDWDSPFLAGSLWVVIVCALAQGLLYFLTTFFRIVSLKDGLPSVVLFPLLKTSTVLVILISAWVFNEWVNIYRPFRIVGIVLATAASVMMIDLKALTRSMPRANSNGPWKMNIATALLTSTGASLMPKVALDANPKMDIFLFILVSNLVNLALALVIGFVSGKETRKNDRIGENGFVAGLIAGLFNFFGLVCYMNALDTGDLSLVASLTSMYFLIPVGLSALFFREEIDIKVHAGIVLTLAAVIFLSF